MARKELAIQITQAMDQYTDDIRAEITSGLKNIGENALQRVKAASPSRTGKFKRGWKLDVEENAGTITMTVHQSKKYASLTHLLEDGHRKRNKKGWVQAQPHIRSVEQWAEMEAMNAIKKAVKG